MHRQMYCPCGAPIEPHRKFCSIPCAADGRRITAEQFWSRVEIGTDDECWPWAGYCQPNGYGSVGKSGYAHRMAFEFSAGEKIPDGMMVLHSCDNRPCCNPAHLRIGTHADNMQDAVDRRRNVVPNPLHGVKLNWEKVDAIRAMRREGFSQPKIGAAFGISHVMVGKIVRNECWHEDRRHQYT